MPIRLYLNELNSLLVAVLITDVNKYTENKNHWEDTKPAKPAIVAVNPRKLIKLFIVVVFIFFCSSFDLSALASKYFFQATIILGYEK